MVRRGLLDDGAATRPVWQRRKARETEVLSDSSDEEDDSSDEEDDVEFVGTKKTTRPRSKPPPLDLGGGDNDDDSDVELLPPKKRRRKPLKDEESEFESESDEDESCGKQPSRSRYLPTKLCAGTRNSALNVTQHWMDHNLSSFIRTEIHTLATIH